MFEELPEAQDRQETVDAKDMKDRWQGVKSTLREIVETVLLTLLIFFAIRALIQNFRIEGTSM